MSRIGKKPITLLPGVTFVQKEQEATVKGPKGELKFIVHKDIKVELGDNKIILSCVSEDPFVKTMFGTTRAILNNMVKGVATGFQKALEIQGVGYKAVLKGKTLVLSLGFSHEVNYVPLEGVDLALDEKQKNIIYVKGIDKQKVGEVAAQIRGFRKPEPYKGKGIRYLGENILRKAGKSATK